LEVQVSDNLPALGGGLLPAKTERQVSRALNRIDAATVVASHRDQARLNRVAACAEHGMIRTAQMGALEAALVQGAPNVANLVHACLTAGSIGLMGVINDVAREG
jgi:hypothetical protein